VIVWWPVVVGLLVTAYLFWGRILLNTSYFPGLLAGYVCSMAQWIFTFRQIYITDYSIPLLFGVYLLAGLADKLAKGRVKGFVLAGMGAAGVAGFLLWAPLLYGMEVRDVDFLLWRRGWRQ
jgi:dolichyl-phosphate-mannose--protein O-mannosyl transferase